ncbi:hypothetical protein [Kamptonema sp. UHCC 0994]|uniref:hypothetical protein n=1 Tax=Kamptonema sp. UHCC 0994 TaxID=3031329 RepID=UPI0023B973ED|nr:hypothetical protein [Kamptonema sp. UHCC 0994]MDF0552629.1 hypothetical protein [Kamptonema sp. UHCC 0994]
MKPEELLKKVFDKTLAWVSESSIPSRAAIANLASVSQTSSVVVTAIAQISNSSSLSLNRCRHLLASK